MKSLRDDIHMNINGRSVLVGGGSIFSSNIDSSAIYQFHYFVEDASLWITFQNETRYIYHEVPMEVAMAVLCAESVGQTFAKLVRNGGYKYERYEGYKYSVIDN